MSVHGLNKNGALVYWEKRRDKWLDAIGTNVVKYFCDFTPSDTTLVSSLLEGWTNTAVEDGTGSSTHIRQAVDGANGVLRWDSAGNESDGLQSQRQCESFKLASGKPCYFGCRFSLVDSDQSEFFVGLSITDTTVVAGSTDSIGFVGEDEDASIHYLVNKDSGGSAVDTAVDAVDGTYQTCEFFFDGTNVRFYVDDVAIATVTSGIPNDEYMTVTIAYLNGDAAQHDGINVDWVRVIQAN